MVTTSCFLSKLPAGTESLGEIHTTVILLSSVRHLLTFRESLSISEEATESRPDNFRPLTPERLFRNLRHHSPDASRIPSGYSILITSTEKYYCGVVGEDLPHNRFVA